MNRVVSCANVQEQWLATGGNMFMKLTSPSGYPRMDLRFTEISVGQGRFGTLLSREASNCRRLASQGHSPRMSSSSPNRITPPALRAGGRCGGHRERGGGIGLGFAGSLAG